MRQTLAVIIGATTVLLVGVVVLTMFNTGIGGLESDLGSTSQQGCEFQIDNADNPDEISEACQPEEGGEQILLRNDESVLNAITSQGTDSSN
jgi:hypothetical protein